MYRIHSILLFCCCVGTNASFGQTLTTSDLPIILINTNNRAIPDEPKMDARMKIIYNGAGQTNRITDTAYFYDAIGIETRGSTSQQISPKKPYAFEARDSVTSLPKNVRFFDMSKESDWSLIAPYSDKTLIRDAMMYQLGNDIMNWAPRTRFCELVINGSYQGVYVLTEKIKRDNGRVDIAKSNPTNPAEGGFIVKVDKTTGVSSGWTSANQTKYLYHYPNPTDITAVQKTYIQTLFADFERVMKTAQYADSLTGYPKYLGINTFIDFILLNEVARNVDGYRLSTYLYKDRDSINPRIKAGPVWDFNIGLGNANYCNGNRTDGWAWDFNTICPADGLPIPFWWNKLTADTALRRKMKIRWTELRQTKWTNAYLMNTIDSLSGVVNQAQVRNFQKWNILTQQVWPNPQVAGSYSGEVNYLRNWLQARLIWLDGALTLTSLPEHPRFLNVPEIFPNPSNGNVNFYYYLHQNTDVKVLIYNMLGKRVESFEAQQNTGHHHWIWNKPAMSGTYLYQIWQNGTVWQTGKLVVF
jgi:CotH kinase protein/Secretion system C-terminal sorting domain